MAMIPFRREWRHFRIVKKRPLTLLEVLIAFALIVIAIFPLVEPRVGIVRQEAQMVRVAQLNHTVNRLYGALLVQLYRNEVAIDFITKDEVTYPFDEKLLKEAGVAATLEGMYILTQLKSKQKEGKGAYLFSVIFAFPGVEKRWEYRVAIYREWRGDDASEG